MRLRKSVWWLADPQMTSDTNLGTVLLSQRFMKACTEWFDKVWLSTCEPGLSLME